MPNTPSASQEWWCSTCTYVNQPDAPKCVICAVDRMRPQSRCTYEHCKSKRPGEPPCQVINGFCNRCGRKQYEFICACCGKSFDGPAPDAKDPREVCLTCRMNMPSHRPPSNNLLARLPPEILHSSLGFLDQSLADVAKVSKFGRASVTGDLWQSLFNRLRKSLNRPIASGSAHSLIARDDGTVWVCGNNNHGQLGLLGDDPYARVNAIISRECFRYMPYSPNSRAYPSQIPDLRNIVSVAAGYWNSFAITQEGHVYAWGQNTEGQLGLGDNQDKRQPRLVSYFFDRDIRIKAVFPHEIHTMFLSTEGNLYACGANKQGQLGLGHYNRVNVPTLITFFRDNNLRIVDAACSCAHTIAIASNGSTYGFGSDTRWQFSNIPLLMPQIKNAVACVVGGASHTWFLTADRQVYGADLKLIPGFGDVVAIAAGSVHSLFLHSNGQVSSCGSWVRPELLGWHRPEPTDLPAPIPNLSKVRAIVAGEYHSLFQLENGVILGSGKNMFLELGMGRETIICMTPQPMSVAPPIGVNIWRHLGTSIRDEDLTCGASAASHAPSHPPSAAAARPRPPGPPQRRKSGSCNIL